MSKQEFVIYANQVIRNQSSLPRTVELRQFKHLLFDKVTIALFIFGIVNVFGVITTVVMNPSLVSNIVGFVFFAFLTLVVLFFITVPFFYIWRWFFALKWGKIEYAQVIELQLAPPGSRSSLEAIENGAARGKWTVYTTNQQITENFYIDEQWAPSLYVGSNVRVLVHPQKLKILMPIGP
jgi:ABC-type multidrug transport system fused ATPase/permease subunit